MRSILIIYGRMALAACLVFVALPCPGQADDYGDARAGFNRLPIDQRYETQALLGIAGYWPAVANDEFNHRLFESITHFQADNGFPASGILTTAQIERVRQTADPKAPAPEQESSEEIRDGCWQRVGREVKMPRERKTRCAKGKPQCEAALYLAVNRAQLVSRYR